MVCDNSKIQAKRVQESIKSVAQLYLEINMSDTNVMIELVKIIGKEEKIKDLKDQDKKSKLLKLAENIFSMKQSLLENMDLFSMMSMSTMKAFSNCFVPTSVEEALIKEFKQGKKPIAGIETAQEQMGYLKKSGISDLDNVIALLEAYDETKSATVELNSLYSDEDLSGMLKLMNTPSDAYDEAYIESVSNILVKQRNLNWVERIPTIASEKTTLFAVGAGHLPGPYGLINLLRNNGFTVVAVME
jgi:uncharacterized protein YbaP (TraB family)